MKAARMAHLDLVRVYATVLVALVHVSATPVVQLAGLRNGDWWVANSFDSFSRTCVPLFIMASGAAVLEQARFASMSEFFRRRVVKIVLPATFWIAFYYCFRCWLMGEALTVSRFAAVFLDGSAFYHLPFIYILLSLYVAAPLLVRIVDPTDAAISKYFAWTWFGLAIALPFVEVRVGLHLGMPVYVATGYAGYFGLGRILRDVEVGRVACVTCAGIIGVGSLCTAIATSVLASESGSFQYAWYDYLMPVVVVMSISTFMLLSSRIAREWLQERKRIARAITWISGQSYGIYLVHPLFLTLFQLRGITWDIMGPTIGIPFLAMLGMVTALLFVQFLRLSRFSAWLVP
ncbi:acyltransferase family protein [Bradyrhizobium sp. UFLA01-814]|uniref:acyltransferase n=1 Tax=Bradyrhizobium sp. UFLA01-814 TaxID=3023480 RepID=UPI00398A6FDE